MGASSSKQPQRTTRKRTIKVKLSSREVKKYKTVFLQFDTDQDGKISSKDLGKIMKKLGEKPTQADLEAMIREVDTDHNGTVEFDEFLVMMVRQKRRDDEEDIELRQIMHELGCNLSDEEVREMIQEADTDGDGLISLEEFKTLMKNLQS
nr:neo-calmodulin-like isoform X1 [Leptinotarsa decemlineata]